MTAYCVTVKQFRKCNGKRYLNKKNRNNNNNNNTTTIVSFIVVSKMDPPKWSQAFRKKRSFFPTEKKDEGSSFCEGDKAQALALVNKCRPIFPTLFARKGWSKKEKRPKPLAILDASPAMVSSYTCIECIYIYI